MPKTELSIIGAGPAGLASGFYARRAGVPHVIYEAGDTVGGNARTLKRGSFRFDTGAHRFHSQDGRSTRDLLDLMGDDLVSIDVPSQIVYNGRFIDFPLSPLNLIRNFGVGKLVHSCVDYARAKLSPNNGNDSFETAVIRQYGWTIANSFLLGYTEKLWGVPASRLSRSVSGRRLRGLNLRTFIIEAFGGSRAKTEHLDGRFYYPRFGIGEIMERLADSCGRDRIHLNSRITRLICSGNRIEQLEINRSERIPVSTVISSLPLSVIIRALDPVPPYEIMEEVSRIRFRNLVLVTLFLNRPRVTRNASLYFPDPGLPITRVYEPKNRSEHMAPSHQTSLALEIPTDIDSDDWKADDCELAERCTRYLSDCGLIQPSEVFDSVVYRIPFAYPILELGYESSVHCLLSYLSRYRNLHIIGRNGEFAYTHIHNLMKAGRETVEKVVRNTKELAPLELA